MELEDESSALKFLNELSKCRTTSPTSEDFVHLRAGIIGNYSLKPEEVEGETLDWALQFLEQRKCPSTLALSMAKCVSEQMSDLATQKSKSNRIEQTDYPSLSLEAVSLHTETLHNLHDLGDCWLVHPEQMNTYVAKIRQPPYYTSICTIKNGRRKMEDRYTVLHDLNAVCGLQNVPHCSYYGVFDGHAGIRAANYASSHLHNNIAQHPAFPTDPVTAIKEGFQLTDNQILEKSEQENAKSGCTVVCSFIQENTLYIAWVGDSQAILVREGVPYIVTIPHKPDRQDERQRIEELNGCVLFIGTWRVNGTLAVSRALGDPEHKPYVSAVPDVVTIPLQGNEDFVVLACDGLWDRLSPSDVASAIYSHLVENQPSDYEDVASRLVQQAKEHGSSDNITAIIVFLKSPQELAANPKNPPSYSQLLDGTKVDNWYQGSWNGISENGNNIFIPPDTMFSESTVKPDSLEIISTAENANNIMDIKKFYFDSLDNETNDNYGNGFKDSCQSSIKPMLPETTVFSELPTPPIDELLASQQFGAQNEVTASLPFLPFDDMSLDSKSSNSTTALADSGILDPENTQTKHSESGNLQNNLMLNLGDVKDDSTSNSNVEVNSEIVNSAVEIVNNAIELAVNQVKVRASSQSSQHPDDSGLEEGPLEESDVSPESTSPEVDKHERSLQDAASVNGKIDEINIKSEELLRSNTDFQNLASQIVQKPEVSLMELSSEQVVCSEMNLDPFESCQFYKHHQDDEQSNIKQITNEQTKEGNDVSSPMLPGKKMEKVELPDTSDLLCFDSVPLMPTIIDIKSLENKVENVESTKEANICSKETQSNIVSPHKDLLEQVSVVETTQHTNLLKPVSVLCTATTESSQSLALPSPFPSEVGQLLEQFTDKEKKPAALSDSLSEDLQVNNAAIDLVAIPDGVPEAEGVTEDADSDSEKDGGWSYIQGGKSDLAKASTPKTSVNNTMKSSNKKPTSIALTTANKSLKKEPAKATTDVKSVQQKPSSMVKKKIIPEKIGKEKLPSTSSNVTARKMPLTSRMAKTTADQTKKSISVVNDQTKKPVTTVSDQNKKPPSTVASKTLREMNKSQPKENASSRPKSASLTPPTKITAPKSNVATVQKTTSRTLSKTQTKTTTPATTTTASLVQKTVQKPLTTTMQRTGTKAVSTVSTTRSVVQTSKISSTRPSVKQIEIKQTKDSTNKQISSKPPQATPKDVMQRNNFSTQVRKSNSVQSSLSTRTTLAQKSAHSKPAPSVHKLTPTTRPPSSRTKPVEQSAAKLKANKEKLKSNEKPKESLSEQEKGTLEAVAKENMSNAVSLQNEAENIPKINDKPIISGDSDLDHLSIEKETEIKLANSICQNEVAVNVEKIETQE